MLPANRLIVKIPEQPVIVGDEAVEFASHFLGNRALSFSTKGRSGRLGGNQAAIGRHRR